MRLTLLSTLAFLLFTSATQALPNDCVLVALEKKHALEAEARLHAIDLWSQILIIRPVGEKTAHAICVFQRGKDSPVYRYDASSGTLTLFTRSHDAAELGRAISAQIGRPIDLAFFLP